MSFYVLCDVLGTIWITIHTSFWNNIYQLNKFKITPNLELFFHFYQSSNYNILFYLNNQHEQNNPTNLLNFHQFWTLLIDKAALHETPEDKNIIMYICMIVNNLYVKRKRHSAQLYQIIKNPELWNIWSVKSNASHGDREMLEKTK